MRRRVNSTLRHRLLHLNDNTATIAILGSIMNNLVVIARVLSIKLLLLLLLTELLRRCLNLLLLLLAMLLLSGLLLLLLVVLGW